MDLQKIGLWGMQQHSFSGAKAPELLAEQVGGYAVALNLTLLSSVSQDHSQEGEAHRTFQASMAGCLCWCFCQASNCKGCLLMCSASCRGHGRSLVVTWTSTNASDTEKDLAVVAWQA